MKGFYQNYPGIHVPENKTLTIKGETAGTGKLTASSNGYGAGIGGGYSSSINCGNIVIEGGVITANGGENAAGIGSASYTTCGSITISGGAVTVNGGEYAAGIGTGYTETSYCGDITISGGTVTATGGENGAGIGTGRSGACNNITISGGTVSATGGEKAAGIGSGSNWGDCGNITITTGVTKVTATKGSDSPNSIGKGNSGSCGTVTIGCTLNNDGNPVGGTTGAISTSPYTYDPSAPATITVTWNNNDITGSGKSFTKDGVTITTANNIDFSEKNFMKGGTFTTTLGNFTKIEVTAGDVGMLSGTGWSGNETKKTWTGNASSVSFSNDIMGQGNTNFVFTIVPTN